MAGGSCFLANFGVLGVELPKISGNLNFKGSLVGSLMILKNVKGCSFAPVGDPWLNPMEIIIIFCHEIIQK